MDIFSLGKRMGMHSIGKLSAYVLSKPFSSAYFTGSFQCVKSAINGTHCVLIFFFSLGGVVYK